MTTAPASGYSSNASRTKGQMKQIFEDLVSLHKEQAGGSPKKAKTLASDTFNADNDSSYFVLTGEGSVADNLATVTGGVDGRELRVRSADPAQLITLKHNTGANKIRTQTGSDILLADKVVITIRFDAGLGAGEWEVVDMFGIVGVAGSTTQVMFNDAGALAGDAGMVYDKTTDKLTLAGALKSVTQVEDVNSNEVLKFSSTASAVNEITVTNKATGAGPTLEPTGGDTNIDLILRSKGTGSVTLADSSGNEVIKTAATASAVNEITVTNKATGANPTIEPTGNDTNIGLNLKKKGTGTVQYEGTEIRKIGPEFTSSDQTITSAGSLTIAHGLGVVPTHVYAALVCQTAEANYSANDVVFYQQDDSAASRGYTCVVDSTNLNIRFGSAGSAFSLLNKNTGSSAALTNGNWKIRFYANR
jgi:hypothetical protein